MINIKGELERGIEKFVQNNDLAELHSFINSNQFYREFVRIYMLSPLGENKMFIREKKKNPDLGCIYAYSSEQLIDIAFLYAVNATIYQQSYNLAINIARNSKKPIGDIFTTQEFKDRFNQFMIKYSQILKDPTSQPYKSAQIAINRIL